MFTRGVDEVRKDWTLVDDGTLVVLPVGSIRLLSQTCNFVALIYLA